MRTPSTLSVCEIIWQPLHAANRATAAASKPRDTAQRRRLAADMVFRLEPANRVHGSPCGVAEKRRNDSQTARARQGQSAAALPNAASSSLVAVRADYWLLATDSRTT